MEKSGPGVKDVLTVELEGVRARLSSLSGEIEVLQQRESKLTDLLLHYNGKASASPMTVVSARERVKPADRVKSAREKQNDALKQTMLTILRTSGKPLTIHDIRGAIREKTRRAPSVDKMRRGIYALIVKGDVAREKNGQFVVA